jgi:hypothetical protein
MVAVLVEAVGMVIALTFPDRDISPAYAGHYMLVRENWEKAAMAEVWNNRGRFQAVKE